MTPGSTVLVVTPTLGTSPFLDQAVHRIAALKIPLMHVISTPSERVTEMGARHPGSQVVADAGRSLGLYGALNAALAAVPDGWEWFTYINDDDLLLPGFGELVRRHLRRKDPEPVAFGDVELVRENGRPVSRVTVERDPSWIPALLQQGISPLMQQGMLFRRSIVTRLGGFDTRYRLCADLDFWLRAYAAGERFRHYALPVSRFRLRDGQLSSEVAVTIREQEEIVGRHLPKRVPGVLKAYARWRYRLCNLPRYIQRIRSEGWKSSYEVLASGARPLR